MRPFFKLSLLFLALICATDVFAQKSKKKKPDNRKSETKEVQVFGEENEEYFSDSKINERNILKINPLLAISGEFPIFYERVLDKHLAVELLGGPTLRPSYAWAFNDIFGEESTVEESYDFINPKIGFMGGFEVKYYASRRDDAPDGFYMGAGVRYKKFNAESFGFDEFGNRATSGETYKTPFTVTDLARVVCGWGNVSDNVFYESYFGFAMRQKKYTKTVAVVDPVDFLVSTEVEDSKKLVPALILGIKIGLTF